jgi:Ca2+/H+ antiporter, TMEM165/GDT1 family
METLFTSTVVVALAEIGDKTQLLALVLAARFQRTWPIMMGILIATLANHGLAAALGGWITTFLAPQTQQWLVAVAFLGMGLWALIPDSGTDSATQTRFGAFLATLIAFFLVEMGDKTQIATVVLAIHYQHLLFVVLGTTLGMLAANGPAVWAGNFAADKLPLPLIRTTTALMFIGLGGVAILGNPLEMDL